LIAVALLFDFLNGLHDAANSIATIVSTGCCDRNTRAVGGILQLHRFLVFGLHVANTIGTGIIEPRSSMRSDLRRLDRPIVWNLITWGSHSLIELARADRRAVGAGMAKRHFGGVWSGLSKTLLAIVLSRWSVSCWRWCLVAIVSWLSVRSTPFAVDRAFRILQFVSASLYSLGHGGNDAQKTMGIIGCCSIRKPHGDRFEIPFWVVLACQARWRWHADGRLAHRPYHGSADHAADADAGFCAENRGAATLFMATWLGSRLDTHTSPAPSSASARPGGFRRCAGTSRARSSMPGDYHPGFGHRRAVTYWAVLLLLR